MEGVKWKVKSSYLLLIIEKCVPDSNDRSDEAIRPIQGVFSFREGVEQKVHHVDKRGQGKATSGWLTGES